MQRSLPEAACDGGPVVLRLVRATPRFYLRDAMLTRHCPMSVQLCPSVCHKPVNLSKWLHILSRKQRPPIAWGNLVLWRQSSCY